MLEKISNSLNIKIPLRDMKFNDPKTPLQSLFNLWLPLSKSLLDMVIKYLPSPVDLTSDKVEHLISSNSNQFKLLPIETQNLKNGKFFREIYIFQAGLQFFENPGITTEAC
jgi:ribosome assembly protein 1